MSEENTESEALVNVCIILNLFTTGLLMKLMLYAVDAVDSLSDVLITVTDNSSQHNISDKMTEAGFTTSGHREIFILVVASGLFRYLTLKSVTLNKYMDHVNV